jgi:hypothetical protein
MLAGTDSPAAAECVTALRAGAPYQVHPDTVSRESALRIYALRAQRTHADQTPTLGMPEALRDLANAIDPQVRIVAISDDRHDFALFLDPDATRIIGCLGVDTTGRRGFPSRDGLESPSVVWFRPQAETI